MLLLGGIMQRLRYVNTQLPVVGPGTCTGRYGRWAWPPGLYCLPGDWLMC